MGIIERRRSIIASQPHKASAAGERYIINVGEPKVNKLEVTFGPIQSGSGTPSPDNVRPIVGLNQISVQMTGKNLLPPTIYNMAYASNIVYEGDNYRAMIAPVKGGETYTISRDVVSGNRFRLYATNTFPSANVQLYTISGSGDSDMSKTFTVPYGYNYLFVYLQNNGGSISSNMQLEVGSTATAYEPYHMSTPSVDLGGTYYGGTVDLVNGTMTVTMGYIAVNGTYFSNYYGSSASASARIAGQIPGAISGTGQAQGAVASNICECKANGTPGSTKAESVPFIAMSANVPSSGRATFFVCFPDSYNITSLEDGKAWVDANGLTLAYRLATPQTVALTPQAISVLRGQQNVQSMPTYCGIPVFKDNAYFPTGTNGTAVSSTYDTDWFIAGPFNTGTTTSKSYTWFNPGRQVHDAAVRFFNNLSSASVQNYPAAFNTSSSTLTYSIPGQYVLFSVYKPLVAKLYMKQGNTYLFNGNDVNNVYNQVGIEYWAHNSAVKQLSYDGIPVYKDNVYFQRSNGTLSDVANGSDWFIAGPFDTGTSNSKSITYTSATVKPEGGMSFRLFDSPTGSSADYWDSAYSAGARTVETTGQYVYASISKTDAANMYMYMTVGGATTYLYKGSNVP